MKEIIFVVLKITNFTILMYVDVILKQNGHVMMVHALIFLIIM